MQQLKILSLSSMKTLARKQIKHFVFGPVRGPARTTLSGLDFWMVPAVPVVPVLRFGSDRDGTELFPGLGRKLGNNFTFWFLP